MNIARTRMIQVLRKSASSLGDHIGRETVEMLQEGLHRVDEQIVVATNLSHRVDRLLLGASFPAVVKGVFVGSFVGAVVFGSVSAVGFGTISGVMAAIQRENIVNALVKGAIWGGGVGASGGAVLGGFAGGILAASLSQG